MANEYKVDLQADTIVKLREITGVGTKPETELYVIDTNGVKDVNEFIEYKKIDVNISDVNVDIADKTAPKLITQNTKPGDEPTEVVHHDYDPQTDTTNYTGSSYINVQVPLTETTDIDNITLSTRISQVPEKGKRISTITVKDKNFDQTTPIYAIYKEYPLNIFYEERKSTSDAQNLDLTKQECIDYYNIDEVTNYTRLTNAEITNIRENADKVTLVVAAKLTDADGNKQYPPVGKLTEDINILFEDLQDLFDAAGYTLVKKELEE